MTEGASGLAVLVEAGAEAEEEAVQAAEDLAVEWLHWPLQCVQHFGMMSGHADGCDQQHCCVFVEGLQQLPQMAADLRLTAQLFALDQKHAKLALLTSMPWQKPLAADVSAAAPAAAAAAVVAEAKDDTAAAAAAAAW